ERRRPLPPPPLDSILRRVDRDAVEPRVERRLELERVELPVNLEKDFLRDIFAFVLIAEEPVDEAHDTVLITLHERTERRLGTPPDLAHQREIVHGSPARRQGRGAWTR